MGLVIVLAVWSAIKRTGSPILCPSLSSVVAVKLLAHEINLNSTLTSSGHSRFNWKYSEYYNHNFSEAKTEVVYEMA